MDLTFSVAPDSVIAESSFKSDLLSTPVNSTTVTEKYTCNKRVRFSIPKVDGHEEDIEAADRNKVSTPTSNPVHSTPVTVPTESSPLHCTPVTALAASTPVHSTPMAQCTAKSKSRKRIRFNSLSTDSQHGYVTTAECTRVTTSTASSPDSSMTNEGQRHNSAVYLGAQKTAGADEVSVPTKFVLYGNDLKTIDSDLLNDNIINAAQEILKQTFTDGGMYDTVAVAAGQAQLINTTIKFAQIVPDPVTQHWLVVTNRGCTANSMRIYCSLLLKPSKSCIQSIVRYLNHQGSTVHFDIMNMAKQKGGADCGVYAIAVAHVLVSGRDPTAVTYDQNGMRAHLRKCLDADRLTDFPVLGNRVVRKKVALEFAVKLYCTCRSLSADDMIQCRECKEWFHQRCVDMDAAEFSTYLSDRKEVYTCGVLPSVKCGTCNKMSVSFQCLYIAY